MSASLGPGAVPVASPGAVSEASPGPGASATLSSGPDAVPVSSPGPLRDLDEYHMAWCDPAYEAPAVRFVCLPLLYEKAPLLWCPASLEVTFDSRPTHI